MSKFFKFNEKTAINLNAYAVIEYHIAYNMDVYCYNVDGDLVHKFTINIRDKDKLDEFFKCLYGEDNV